MKSFSSLKPLIHPWESVATRDLSPPLSAVLVPLAVDRKTGEKFIILTKRTETLASHKGQVSFPGGIPEKSDENLLATAFRESEEETGLCRKDVEVLGMLDPVKTRNEMRIFPFVGVLEIPYPFQVNPAEVAKLLYFPVSTLLDPGLKPVIAVVEGVRVSSWGTEFEGELIWGATARVLEVLRGKILSL